MTNALFSLLATATFARMMLVSTGLNQDATFALDRQWFPVAAWMLAAGLLLVIALRRGVAAGVMKGFSVISFFVNVILNMG